MGIKNIRKDLESKAACHWGQGEIDGTVYYKLTEYSPRHYGDKITIVVCRTKIVEQIENEK